MLELKSARERRGLTQTQLAYVVVREKQGKSCLTSK